MFINFLNSIFFSIIDFTNSVLPWFFNNYIFVIVLLISIIYLSSNTGKILDTVSKVVTIATGSTVLYNNRVKDSSSDNENDDKKDDKKDNKNKDNNDKKDDSKQGTKDEQ